MVPPSCGNPLLRDWIKEWMEDAKAMQMKSFYTYKKAYDSISRYPIAFSHPSEAVQLNGIGPNTAQRLEEKMIQYCQDNGLPIPVRSKGRKRNHQSVDSPSAFSSSTPIDSGDNPSRKKRAPRPYIPRYRSGTYAILLCLLDFKDEGRNNAIKDEIINKAQVYCDTSMDLAEPGQNYTAWSGIKTLKEKGYVWQNGSPPRFMLTESGENLAIQLRNASNNNSASASDRNNNTQRNTNSNSNNNDSSTRKNRSSGLESVWDDYFDSLENNNNNGGVDLSLYVLNPTEHHSQTSSTSLSSNANMNTNTLTTITNQSFSSQVDVHNLEDTDETDDIYLYDHNSESISNNHVSTSISTINNSQNQIENVYLNNNSINNSNNKNNNKSSINNCNNRNNNTSNDRSNINNDSVVLSESNDNDSPALILPSFNKNNKRKNSTSTSSSQLNCQPEVITLLTPSPPSSPVLQSVPHFNQQESSNQSFQYTYLNTEDKHVRHLSQASVKIDHITQSLLYKIRFSSHQKYHSKIKQLKYVNESDCTAYICETIAEMICSGLPPRPLLPLHEESQSSQISTSSQKTTTNNISNNNGKSNFWPSDSQSILSNSQQINDNDDVDSEWINNYNGNTQSSYGNNDILTSSQKSISSMNNDYVTDINTQYTANTVLTDTVEETSMMDYVSSVKRDGKIWLPEEYTIMMILDNREVKMKTNREYINDTLCEKGVLVMKRALDLGDVIWVAKHNSTNEEMYLDIVVERKRLDDLVQSVKDGRYKEQKFRLKYSGSRKIIYIIEEYNKEEINKIGAKQIRTAMSSVQAVDGFYLKRTNNLEETIDYLVCVTKMVQMMYKNVKLQEIPARLITKENYREIKNQLHNDTKQQVNDSISLKIYHVISYSLYNQINSKSGSSTLQDLYMKMLMTIRGVSAEKAYSLLKHYPTPHQLLKAMNESTIEDGKKIAMDATKGNLHRRRWTPQLSERLWDIWGQ